MINRLFCVALFSGLSTPFWGVGKVILWCSHRRGARGRDAWPRCKIKYIMMTSPVVDSVQLGTHIKHTQLYIRALRRVYTSI